MNSAAFCKKIAYFIKEDIPFFFLVDFEKEKPVAIPLSDCLSEGIHFQFLKQKSKKKYDNIPLIAQPAPYEVYQESFDKVMHGLKHGDSFLVNLTYPTPIQCEASLTTIYKHAKALYKLQYKDEFVVFSPESFIQIRDNRISTFPMKGTIMASTPRAIEVLLSNKKEQWEHNTIVDLMRNDLSMVAENVEVNRFRFISEIETENGRMFQTSSEITGDLKPNWSENFGEMLLNMLPAGSISGAPKDKTVAIIRQAEPDKRGYYTGVFGIYKHGQVDSAVAIRYIEKNQHSMIYRSGGGITFMSESHEEYQELINKIYIPTQ